MKDAKPLRISKDLPKSNPNVKKFVDAPTTQSSTTKVESKGEAPKKERKKGEKKSEKKIKTKEQIKNECKEFENSNRLIPMNEAWWKEMESEMTYHHIEDPIVGAENKDKGGLSLSEAESLGYNLWNQQLQLFAQIQKNKSGSDHNWLSMMVQKGTLTDRMASMTVFIQQNPIHSFNVLKMLLSLTKKNQRREAGISIETMKDLFIETLMPKRKLRAFSTRCFSDPSVNPKLLFLWYFEDQLKNIYSQFIGSIEIKLNDNLKHFKDSLLKVLQVLLVNLPEKEQLLLTLLVNKLGDPDKKVAGKVVHFLQKIIEIHPDMNYVISKEVQNFVFHPKSSEKGQYYAAVFLNQLQFRKKRKDENLAKLLIDIYFTMFTTYVKKDKIKTKMLSALLTGVNRAFPYAPQEESLYTDQLDVLYQVCHKSNFATACQALLLLFQIHITKSGILPDRYYRAVYAKMLSREIFENKRHALFLNICFKTLKNDPVPKRVSANLKRLLQVSLQQKPTFICGALIVFSEVLKLKPEAALLIKEPERIVKMIKAKPQQNNNKKNNSNNNNEEDKEEYEESDVEQDNEEDEEMESGSDEDKKWDEEIDSSEEEDFELPDRIKIEDKNSNKNKKTSSKPTTPTSTTKSSTTSDKKSGDKKNGDKKGGDKKGGDKKKDDKKNSLKQEDESPENLALLEDLRKEKNFQLQLLSQLSLLNEPVRDKKTDERNDRKGGKKAELNKTKVETFEEKGASGVVHEDSANSKYDPQKRDPLFANAQNSCFWELSALQNHFHPSVVKFANQIMQGEHILYPSDPLKDFTFQSFLDKFSYKKPKKNPKMKNSIHAPNTISTVKTSKPVNSKSFLSKPIDKIRPDEVFFHKFFQQTKRKKKEGKESEESDEQEGELSSSVDQDSNAASDYSDEDDAPTKKTADSKKKKQAVGGDDDEDFSGEDLEGMDNQDNIFQDKTASYEDERGDFDSDLAGDEDDLLMASQEEYDYADLAKAYGNEDDLVMNPEDDSVDENLKTLFSSESDLSDDGGDDGDLQKEESEKIFANAEEYAEILENDDEEKDKSYYENKKRSKSSSSKSSSKSSSSSSRSRSDRSKRKDPPKRTKSNPKGRHKRSKK